MSSTPRTQSRCPDWLARLRRAARIAAGALCLCLVCTPCWATEPVSGDNTALSAELSRLRVADQDFRARASELRQLHGADSVPYRSAWEAQQEADRRSLRDLEAIIDHIAWSGLFALGEEAAITAQLIVQHASPEDQRRHLQAIRTAVLFGSGDRALLAKLEDRVLVGMGKRQVYGTQLYQMGDSPLRFWPIENIYEVDLRRQRMGLEPIAELAYRFGIEPPNWYWPE